MEAALAFIGVLALIATALIIFTWWLIKDWDCF